LGTNFQGGTITNLTLGSATLSGNQTVNGTLNFTNGLSGSLTVLGGAVVNWGGGTIANNLTVLGGAVMNWSGGTASGPINIASNGVLNISPGSQYAVVDGTM